eukprot:jgi/Mesvir1/2092/Mv16624-RA.1
MASCSVASPARGGISALPSQSPPSKCEGTSARLGGPRPCPGHVPPGASPSLPPTSHAPSHPRFHASRGTEASFRSIPAASALFNASLHAFCTGSNDAGGGVCRSRGSPLEACPDASLNVVGSCSSGFLSGHHVFMTLAPALMSSLSSSSSSSPRCGEFRLFSLSSSRVHSPRHVCHALNDPKGKRDESGGKESDGGGSSGAGKEDAGEKNLGSSSSSGGGGSGASNQGGDPAKASGPPGASASSSSSSPSSYRSKHGKGKDKDEVAPALETDWRAFRARLFAMEQAEQIGKSSAPGPASSMPGANNPAAAPSASATGGAKSRVEPRSPVTRRMIAAGRWAHPLARVEKGCLLLADENLGGLFSQTVIFILEHGPQGTLGVILNRPTGLKMGDLGGLTQKMSGVFAGSDTYMGGPVAQNTILILHGKAGISKGDEVVDGVFTCQLDEATAAVASGAAKPVDFRFFLGHSGWAPGQLQQELNMGSWYVGAGSSDIVTNQCLNLRRPLWRQIMDLLGGKPAAVVARMDDEDGGQYLGTE